MTFCTKPLGFSRVCCEPAQVLESRVLHVEQLSASPYIFAINFPHFKYLRDYQEWWWGEQTGSDLPGKQFSVFRFSCCYFPFLLLSQQKKKKKKSKRGKVFPISYLQHCRQYLLGKPCLLSDTSRARLLGVMQMSCIKSSQTCNLEQTKKRQLKPYSFKKLGTLSSMHF